MTIAFAPSARSTVGIEWELMLADPETGDLVGRAPEIMPALEEATAHERHTVTAELLTNTVEVTSGVGDTVAAAVDDISDAIGTVREQADPLGIELMCAGSHPFARWFDQEVTDKTRYAKLIDRTQWWGRNQMIWGIHVHVGVDDVDKVFPIIHALTGYIPHLQALSASSPFWAGERTGYASNRAQVFQQLPTTGLPWQLQTWSEYESYIDDMQHTGVIADATEVRWDIRPAAHWGTIEVRACDGMSTLPELAAVAALVQTLVESFSRDLDEGRELPALQPWFTRENKWRAARYGLDARAIVDREGTQRLVSDHLRETLDRLEPIAAELKCAREFAEIGAILDRGASYQRQIAVADASDGDLNEVARSLIREFRSGPTLRDRIGLGRLDAPGEA
ncbi:glutamate--cysteine ligase [Microbacterium marinilacus]|uniref:Putative glutamate--cysteine ligase 2 n=1 Tax=Microbacterium marinilacus TaxID=415209 RepID=A0ABP7B453_9MICO|nr:glutamate--cysteine ligase [Microbacterium marinilacus]MBY0687951.1 glutamate--cysteine ligase [Microbacterium marinilacus]